MKVTCMPFLKNRDGNLAILTAFLLPVLVMMIGLAIDYSTVSHKKAELQYAVDAAALATTSAMINHNASTADAKTIAENMIKGHLNIKELTINATAEKIALSAYNSKHNARIAVTRSVPLSGFQVLIGYKVARITAVGHSEAEIDKRNPISLFLVLDRSGSMGEKTTEINTAKPNCASPCFYTKMEALKLASKALIDQLNASDVDRIFVRLGAVSYNDAMQTPQNLVWGTGEANAYVNALAPGGNTNSGPATTFAYNALSDDKENVAHTQKSGDIPRKFILLMTDGANGHPSFDTETLQACAKAKSDGMKVFGVAFAAPDRGKQLISDCSSGTGYYYEASNMTEIVKAFEAIGKKTTKIVNRLSQ